MTSLNDVQSVWQVTAGLIINRNTRSSRKQTDHKGSIVPMKHTHFDRNKDQPNDGNETDNKWSNMSTHK